MAGTITLESPSPAGDHPWLKDEADTWLEESCPPELAAQLERCAAENGAAPEQLAQAVVRLLLLRRSGDENDDEPFQRYLARVIATPPAPAPNVTFDLAARKVRIGYAQRSVKRALVENFAAQLWLLAAQVSRYPQRSIYSASLLTAADAALLPQPSAPLPEPPYVCVWHLFERQVRERPRAVALTHRKEQITYAELRDTVGRLMDALHSRGMRPGDIVSIETNKSPGAIVAMLAVLGGGGVLLMVEPGLPAERKRLVTNEGGAKLRVGVLPEGAQDLPGEFDLVIDHQGLLAAGEDAGSGESIPAYDAQPDDPAYIVFTSGSTGVPKAILGRHKSISEAVEWQSGEFRVGIEDRCSQLVGVSFEPILREVFVALTSGAALCIPSTETGLGASNILPWLAEEAVSVLCVTPTLARGWIEDNVKNLSISSVRVTFFGGEPLTALLVKRWRELCPNTRIVNVYGTSETAFIRAYYEVPAEPAEGIQPIGRAVPSTQLLLLNRGGTLCGRGERGEICVRTKYLPLKYLNDRVLTQEKFCANVFREAGAPDAADVVFRTGDIGSYDAEGRVEIHGRADDQVKIHGVRIEPAEVNVQLEQHPKIAESIVLPGLRDDERILLAFAAQRGGEELAEKDVREWLKARLPQMLIPSRIVIMQQLPRTPTGKIDRRALRTAALEPSGAEPEPETAAAATSLVVRIQQVWSELLAVEVGENDDFFQVGGDSFSAIRVVSRLNDELNVELSLRDFFELEELTPTTLAEVVRSRQPAAAAAAAAAPSAPANQEPWNVQPGYDFWAEKKA